MFIEKVVIFMLFLGPLVFFHELGHFLFARLFGVRVEVFSIGFGPKLFKFKKGDTQYAFSLIPLGGYIKMFGDNPLAEVEFTPEEAAVAYTRKSKWARFWIIFGGPLANFIFAFVIYFLLLVSGEKLPEVKFGVVPSNHTLYSLGLRTGDVLNQLNDQEILSFDDFNLIDSDIKSVVISRERTQKTLFVNMTGETFVENFTSLNRELRAPVFVDEKGKSYHVIVKNNEMSSIEELVERNISEVEVRLISSEFGKEFNLKKVKYDPKDSRVIAVENKDLLKSLRDNGFYPRDLLIENIISKSAADQAKLKKGDIILSMENQSIYSFNRLREVVQKNKGLSSLKISLLSDGVKKEVLLTPQITEANGKETYVIGIWSGVVYNGTRNIEMKSSGFFDGVSKAISRTHNGITKTLLGFKKLITAEVSMKNIGGPIAIGQVAADSFNISLSMFFRLMAIISINLGIINLFPIPVLDGGHIVFIFMEILNRGPLSKRKMELAQQFGLSLLFLLIFVALFNDISRFF